MAQKQDPRDIIIAELQAEVDYLMRTMKEVADVTDQVMEEQDRLHAIELENQGLRLRAESHERENAFKREVNTVYSSFIATQTSVLETLQRGKATGAAAPESVQTQLEALARKMACLNQSVEIMLDGGHPGPLLSEALEHWFKVRSGLGIDQKKVDTDYNRVRDFISYAGDKPINRYRYLEFQEFANLLAHVPASFSLKPEFKGMTQFEAAAHNRSLDPLKRHKTLTGKTIESNYLSPLNMIFHDMCAHHGFRSPLANVSIRISGEARASTDRLPIEVPELNKWFVHAAKESRGDSKWLPLLGTVAGARIGELIWLQKKDIYQVEG
ncbi:hypothetical protein A4X03_0g9900, partial [Tilletia caries]